MTRRTLLLVGLLLTLFSVLACTLQSYDTRQQAIGREGNRLLSPDAITVEGNARDIVAALGADRGDVRVFRALDESGTTRAVIAGAHGDLAFPVHAGRSLTDTDSHAALVGDRVPVLTEGDSRYVLYDGERYEVVGRLGLSPDSLLAADTLLSNPGLFTVAETKLTVDGAQIRDRYTAAFGATGIEAVSTAVSKRTNIDFLSPLILSLGTALVVLGWVFAGLLVRSATRARSRVLLLLGATRRRRLLVPAAQVLALSAFAMLAACALTALLSPTPVSIATAISGIMIQATIVVSIALIGSATLTGTLRVSDD